MGIEGHGPVIVRLQLIGDDGAYAGDGHVQDVSCSSDGVLVLDGKAPEVEVLLLGGPGALGGDVVGRVDDDVVSSLAAVVVVLGRVRLGAMMNEQRSMRGWRSWRGCWSGEGEQGLLY